MKEPKVVDIVAHGSSWWHEAKTTKRQGMAMGKGKTREKNLVA